MRIRVIGGGLAGPEAALMAAAQGAEVLLYEMRPARQTPAHQTAESMPPERQTTARERAPFERDRDDCDIPIPL